MDDDDHRWSRAATSSDQSRWYSRLNSRGYRLAAPPSALLRVAIECLARDRSVLESALCDTISTILLSIRESPRYVSQECLEYPPPFISLCHEEQVYCARTSILVFVAWLSSVREPPPWVMRSYPVNRLRRLVEDLSAPAPASGIALARDIMGPSWAELSRAIESMRERLRTDQAPERQAYAQVHDALATAAVTLPSARGLLRPSLRLTAAIAQGGLAGLYWPYMFVALELARVRSWPPANTRGLCGALECVADDVAAPICRLIGERRGRALESNRRRLHSARQHVLEDELWGAWALDAWNWSGEENEQLAEFRDFVDFVR